MRETANRKGSRRWERKESRSNKKRRGNEQLEKVWSRTLIEQEKQKKKLERRG